MHKQRQNGPTKHPQGTSIKDRTTRNCNHDQRKGIQGKELPKTARGGISVLRIGLLVSLRRIFKGEEEILPKFRFGGLRDPS